MKKGDKVLCIINSIKFNKNQYMFNANQYYIIQDVVKNKNGTIIKIKTPYSIHYNFLHNIKNYNEIEKYTRIFKDYFITQKQLRKLKLIKIYKHDIR